MPIGPRIRNDRRPSPPIDGQTLKPLSSQAVPVGDGAAGGQRNAGPEIGLAVAPPRDDGVVLLAVSDAGQRQVLELPYAPVT